MCSYDYTVELYHHGIKGQRWGIRRFQKKDGSLTPAGKKRYSDGEPSKNDSKPKKKSKHQLMLEEKYTKAGMTPAEAETAARRRIITERALTAAAGLSLAAGAAYAARNHVKARTDGLIKAGDALQRVEMKDTNGKLHDVFYASKDKRDNTRYAGLLGLSRYLQTGEAYLMELESQKDIKVASRDKAAKVFGDLYKNDSEFRSQVADHVGRHFAGGNRVDDINDMSPKNIKKMYENFNCDILDFRHLNRRPDLTFYNKLKSEGYGAIQDINDMKFTGFNAKNPLIIFGNSDNIMVKTVKKMSGDKLKVDGIKEAAKANGERAVREALEAYGPVVAFVSTSAAVRTYVEDYRSESGGENSKWKTP